MKAVILAAGKGTRLHPLTFSRPKHLVPLGGKPIIEHVLAALLKAEISEVIFVVKYMAEYLKQHLGDGSEYNMNFDYVIQKQLQGTADATSSAEQFVKEDFLLTYGDWLITSNVIKSVIQTHKNYKPTATIGVVPVENPEQYGVVELDDNYVRTIVEKPCRENVTTDLINAGIYILSTEIFDAIRCTDLSSRGELEITDSFSVLLKRGHKIAAAKLSKKEMCDVGILWNLFDANRWVLEKTMPKVEGKIEDATHLIGPVTVEEGARIRSGAYIEGPSKVSCNSDIGPNCFIRPFTSISEKVRIGNACEIKNSIIMKNTHIGHLSYIGDSVIGENCNLGASTTIANYRFDEKSIKMKIKQEILDTGRRKLGVVLGDNVKTGINSSFMPGVKVGNNCWIGPNVIIDRDVPPNTTILLETKQTYSQRLSQSQNNHNPKKA